MPPRPPRKEIFSHLNKKQRQALEQMKHDFQILCGFVHRHSQWRADAYDFSSQRTEQVYGTSSGSTGPDDWRRIELSGDRLGILTQLGYGV